MTNFLLNLPSGGGSTQNWTPRIYYESDAILVMIILHTVTFNVTLK